MINNTLKVVIVVALCWILFVVWFLGRDDTCPVSKVEEYVDDIEDDEDYVYRKYVDQHRDDGSAHCPWLFDRYEPSSFELLWRNNAEKWQEAPCKRYLLDGNDKNAEIWYNYSFDHQNDRPSSDEVPADLSVFSNMVYKKKCTEEIINIPIEPLALALRNPLFCIDEKFPRAIDKSHIYPDWMMEEQRRDSKGKAYFFDLGASIYNDGDGGASQSWFIKILEERGIQLDGIWAWEYRPYNTKQIFNAMPAYLVPIYHWFNVGVNSKKNSRYNPWVVLKQVASVDDLVIVKLDIDTPSIELDLNYQMLADPEIAKLIDVYFYEDHISIEEMKIYWGPNFTRTLSESIDLFTKLRERGIRAHPWI